ncbi:MAG: response regulator [Myxococcota bacterium]
MPRRKSSPPGPVYFTSYEVAKILGVSNQTVVNWVNSNRLVAHRTLGGHRRIAKADVVSFARDNGYPLARELVDTGSVRKRVLVVDDEVAFADLVREYLSAKGFEVEIADSGFAAGLTVARYKPDLIVMDLMMPGMDGFEVHRTLRRDADTCHVPVIACTGYRDPDIDRKIRDERFDGFVDKPLKLDGLVDLIRDLLHLQA